jgi:hypothetical protein
MANERQAVLEISVLLESVDWVRLSEKATENMISNYSLNVSLSEKDRTSDALVLAFSLELSSQPQAARLKVAGAATLKGTKDEIKEGITAHDESKPPPVLVTIYERVYSTLYLVATALRVPSPMPNLLKKTP